MRRFERTRRLAPLLPPDPVLTEQNRFVSARVTNPDLHARFMEYARRAILAGRAALCLDEWKERAK